MGNRQEQEEYNVLVCFADMVGQAVEMRGVEVSVKRCVKRFLEPQKYEIAFQDGSWAEFEVLTYKESALLLGGIQRLLRMMPM